MKKYGKKLDHRTLAEGEVTNHSHQATGEGVQLWLNDGGVMTMEAPYGSVVKHEEHKPIEIPPGVYERRIVREYDHWAEEAREVRD